MAYLLVLITSLPCAKKGFSLSVDFIWMHTAYFSLSLCFVSNVLRNFSLLTSVWQSSGLMMYSIACARAKEYPKISGVPKISINMYMEKMIVVVTPIGITSSMPLNLIIDLSVVFKLGNLFTIFFTNRTSKGMNTLPLSKTILIRKVAAYKDPVFFNRILNSSCAFGSFSNN